MVLGVVFLQAVVFAALSGIVASNKNRDAFGWGVLGFLFGLFGFIAAVAVGEVEPDKEKTSNPQKRSSSRQKSHSSSTREFDPDEHEKKCPMCAEYIKLEARRCKHCGHEFSDEEVERQIEERRTKVKQKQEREQAPTSMEKILATHDFSNGSTCNDCGVSKSYAKNSEYECPS